MPVTSRTLQTVSTEFRADRLAAARPIALGITLIAPSDTLQVNPQFSLGAFLADEAAATRATAAKAAQVGAGAPTGELTGAGDGWVRAYSGVDVYYSKATGAREVHGDIRAKYNVLHGADGPLGLPTTDETGTPDGVGRFNHFERGSIYWTAHTGPMMVRGPVRDQWASEGWERGQLGFPVSDEQRVIPLHPSDHPNIAWSLFENGGIVATNEGARDALAADVSPDQLRGFLRKRIDDEVHKSPDNVGLHPGVETVAVSGWSYNFWGALPRMITFRLHGFHDNGLAPDTDFDLELRLRFSLVWSTFSFTQPASKSLAAALDSLSVTAHGIASGAISQGVYDGVNRAFHRGGPDPDHPEVPDGAVFVTSIPTGVDQTGSGNLDVLDVLTTADGGLQILVNPLPIFVGAARRQLAQNAVDGFFGG